MKNIISFLTIVAFACYVCIYNYNLFVVLILFIIVLDGAPPPPLIVDYRAEDDKFLFNFTYRVPTSAIHNITILLNNLPVCPLFMHSITNIKNDNIY